MDFLSADPKLDRNLVRYMRGIVEERYVVRAGSIEQQFVLEHPPEGRGDLVIGGAVQAPAAFEAGERHWRWSQGAHAVNLGDVYVFDAEGRQLPASMQVHADSTEIIVNGAALSSAAYPVTIDPEIGANDFRISEMGADGLATFDGIQPSVAYNATDDEYLVVWHGSETTVGDEDIWGQRIDASSGAELGSDFQISFEGSPGTLDDGLDAAVAWNSTNNEFLVVFEALEPDFDREIKGRFVSNTGTLIGAGPIVLSDLGDGAANPENFTAANPDLAYNSTNNTFLVCFVGDDDLNMLVEGEQEVFCQLVDAATRAETGSNDFQVSNVGGANGNASFDVSGAASLVWNSTDNEWLVVWESDNNVFGVVDGEFEIFGQRLNGSNAAEIGSDFRISTVGGSGTTDRRATEPDVAYNSVDNEYLVVWRADDGATDNENELYGQRLSAAGAEIGTDDFQITSVGTDGDTSIVPNDPQIAHNPVSNRYFVVWFADDTDFGLQDNELEIFGQLLNADGSNFGVIERLSDVGGSNEMDYDATRVTLAHRSGTAEYLVVFDADDDAVVGLVEDESEIWGQRFSEGNLPPSITAAGPVAVTQGSSVMGVTIATVSDVEDGDGTLTVTVPSPLAGITFSNITNTNGTITATVSATVAAAVGANLATLQVEDSGSLTNSDVLTVNVSALPMPALTVAKSSTTGMVMSAGQVVPYTYTVTNSGDVPLTNVTLSDDNSDAVPSCTPSQPAALAVSAVMNCTAQHTVTLAEMNAGGSLTNVATAASNESPNDQDTLSIPIVQSPSLSLSKSSTTTSVTNTGQVVPYTYVVTNTGNITLTNVALADDNSDAAPSCTPAQPAALAPGASMNCTAQHTVTQIELDAGGNLSNTATATSVQAASVQDSLSIPIVQTPSLSVGKSSTTTSVSAGGEVVPYTYVVTNVGNVTLNNVTLADDNTDAAPSCAPAQPATLAPGASMSCTAQHTVTQSEMDAGGNLSNTATADSDESSSAQDSLSIPINQAPALSVAKSSTTASVTSAGQIVPYTYVVSNSGNVTLNNVTLADDNTDAAPSCAPSQPATLAPGASMNCTAQHSVTQTEIDGGGNLTNTATADSDESSAAQDVLSIPIGLSPALSVAASSTTALVTAAGQVVPYLYVVTNTGNATLNNVSLDDPSADATPVCSPSQPATLAPSASMSCTAQRTVTQGEVDAGGNLSSAASADSDESASVQDIVSILIDQNPQLALDKSALAATYSFVGEVVGYQYTVTNSGNVTISGPVAVSDDNDDEPMGVSCPGGNLAPGGSIVCTAQRTVAQSDLDTGSITNTATATGTDPASQPVTSASDSETVNAVQASDLNLTKDGVLDLGPNSVADPGDSIDYTFVVVNNGNVNLSNINVADPLINPVTCPSGNPIPVLAPGASETCTGSYSIVQGDIDSGVRINTATATGQDPGSNPVTANGFHSETIPQTADLTLDKTVEPMSVMPGESVMYTLTVTNLGPSTATMVEVVDQLPSGLIWDSDDCGAGPPVSERLTWSVGSLAINASAVCRISATVSPTAPGASLLNSATASSAEADPDPGSSSSSVGVDIDRGAEIPTLQEWGLILLTALLISVGLLSMRRKRGGSAGSA